MRGRKQGWGSMGVREPHRGWPGWGAGWPSSTLAVDLGLCWPRQSPPGEAGTGRLQPQVGEKIAALGGTEKCTPARGHPPGACAQPDTMSPSPRPRRQRSRLFSRHALSSGHPPACSGLRWAWPNGRGPHRPGVPSELLPVPWSPLSAPCPLSLAKAMLSSMGQSAVLLGPLSQALGAPRWQSPWQHSLTLRGTLAQGEGTGLPVFLSPRGEGAEDT